MLAWANGQNPKRVQKIQRLLQLQCQQFSLHHWKPTPAPYLLPLVTSNIQNPILVRSKSKKDAEDKADKAEHRINKAIAAQKKALRSIGHVEDLSTNNAKDIEYERTMRETARRGVIKIFNAVNASQIKAEQAQREARGLGPSKLQEQVKDMSRERFLDLIKSA